MFADDKHVAHARYYLAEAARGQPSVDDPELYRRVGEMALRKSQFATAIAAFGTLRAKDVATADDLERLAQALQSSKGSADEAADAYARAYELDGTRHHYLRDRAILLAQSGDHARAADLFQQYLDNGKPEAKERAGLEERIEMLRAQAKADPKSPEEPKAP
jgi:cytochrome c-type biogenesis protein CcmH/NrfG